MYVDRGGAQPPDDSTTKRMLRHSSSLLIRSIHRRNYHRSSWENEFKWSSKWQNIKERPTLQYVGLAAVGSLASYALAMVIDAEREKARRTRWLSQTKSKLFSRTADQVSDSSLKAMWDRLRDSQKTMVCLVGVNSAVFLAWRVPSLERFMSRWFLHSTSSHPLTMLTSIFSHKTPTHFAFNMLALWSFGTLLHDRLGREHFMAFYTTSGLCSSLGSHMFKLWRHDTARSLGASGALFGVAGACAHIPDVKVSLIFLPFHSFSLDKVLPAIMLFDLVGLVRGWQSFDHAAHLSGAITGYLLYDVSTRRIWANRYKILQSIGYPLKSK